MNINSKFNLGDNVFTTQYNDDNSLRYIIPITISAIITRDSGIFYTSSRNIDGEIREDDIMTKADTITFITNL